MNSSRKGLAMVLISSFVFGTVPSAVTFCYSQGATSTLIIIVRYIILALLMLPAVLRDKVQCLSFLRRKWKFLSGLSFFCTVTPLLLFQAYKLLPTSTATAIHFMYPTIVMLLSVLVFREKISGTKFLCFLLCFGGIALMLDTSVGGVSMAGVLFALVSGLTWACYIVAVDRLDLGTVSSSQMMFFVEVGNLILIAFYCLFSGGVNFEVTMVGWAAIIVSNIIISVFGTLFFTIGVRYTDAQVSSIASTFEPITSVLVGVFLLGEPFTMKNALGTGMILAAVIVLSLFETAKTSTE